MKIEGSGFTYPEEEAEKEAAEVVALASEHDLTRKTVYRSEPEAYPYRGECTWKEVKEGTKPLGDFVASLTDEQLSCLCIGDYKESQKDTDEVMDVIGDASGTVAGAAGETTTRLEGLGVGSAVMADGPAGLRLSTAYSLEGNVAKQAEPEEAGAAVKADPTAQIYYQYCTAIPIGTALAQSWNDELSRSCGDIVGKEMETFGTPVWLAPAIMKALSDPEHPYTLTRAELQVCAGRILRMILGLNLQ
ncbi:MAG: hypothetical protein K2O13_05645 [Lachnospiraceae bacterium]|nr:hypothetical protein [Lachnospiraceae bacterium]